MPEEHDSRTEPIHIMLTVLGVTVREAMTYQLHGKPFDAVLAPIALYHLLKAEQRPQTILALCTEEAKEKAYPVLEKGLEGQNLKIRALPLAEGGGSPEQFLAQLYREIPGDQEVLLTLDVTHGFRHLSFLCYIGALFLSALRPKLRIHGAYYGMYQEGSAIQPFQDLRPLLELPTWFAALEEFRRAGSTRGLEFCFANHLAGAEASHKNIQSALAAVGEAYRAAIPLELGEQVARLISHKKPIQKAFRSLPGGAELQERFLGAFADFELLTPPTFGDGCGWKGKFELTESELHRQVRLIRSHLDQRSFPPALGLMREWIISWLLWSEGKTTGQQWVAEREEMERKLGAFSQLDGRLSQRVVDDQHVLPLWKSLTELRNALHHHGMRKGNYFKESSAQLDVIKSAWHKLVDRVPMPKATLRMPASRGKVLVTAMGTTPGSLYSAIKHTRPDHAIVVTSTEMAAAAFGAAAAAGFCADALTVRAFADPVAGAAEKDPLLEGLDEILVAASEVLLCLTGGTTLTNFASAELADRARALNIKVTTIGLADRRPRELQETDPYQLGEVFELKKRENKRR